MGCTWGVIKNFLNTATLKMGRGSWRAIISKSIRRVQDGGGGHVVRGAPAIKLHPHGMKGLEYEHL